MGEPHPYPTAVQNLLYIYCIYIYYGLYAQSFVVCRVLCRMLRGVHQALVRLLSVRYVHQFSTAFLPSPLVRLLSVRYVHQFSTAFLPSPLVRLLSVRYVHQFSTAFPPSPLVRLLSVRYVHQFSTAFPPSPLVRLLSVRYVHKFSPVNSRMYLAVYEQS